MGKVKMDNGSESRVLGIIVGHGRGWCFTAKNFLGIGSDDSLRKALSNLQKKNIIRRLARGIYEYPRIHKDLGVIPPDLNDIARAIAEKNGVHIQPTGAYAANLVGLSEQVPGQITFLTEGPSRIINIGNQTIVFKKAVPKVMLPAGTREGILIEALKNIGKEHIDPSIRSQIRKYLKHSSEEAIQTNLRFAPSWIRSLVYNIMEIES